MKEIDKKIKNYADELAARVVDVPVWWTTPNKDMDNQTPEQLWNQDWTKVIKHLHIMNNL